MNLTSCQVKDIVNEIIPFLIKEIADKGIRFSESYHPQLPSLRIDKNQMHQVFLNLFLNAIQAMPQGGDLRIQVHPMLSSGVDGTQQSMVRILVSDTGRGIPANLITRIFDHFFTTKPKGIGLGLSIAYQIIKKHEGTIQVRSEWEKGTTFDIRLPEKIESL